MKQSKYIILALGVTMLASCESMLEVTPRLQIASEQGLQDLTGVNATLNATYSGLRGSLTGAYYGRTMILNPEMLADNTRLVNAATRSGRGLGETTNQPGSHINIWGGFANHNIWQSINLANLILENTDKITASIPQKSAIKAQALFVRALIYFDLARVYGYNPNFIQNGFSACVPIITKAVDDLTKVEYPARNTTAEVFQQVEKDLLEAIKLFGEAANPNARAPFFATRTSSQALLARLYLYWGGGNNDREKLQKAVQQATEALNQATTLGRGLTATNALVASWGTARAGAAGLSESLFEINYAVAAEALNGDNAMQGWLQRNAAGTTGWGDVVASNELLQLFETGDVRRQLYVPYTRADGEVVQMCNKFSGTKGTFGWDNIPVIRTAEVVLTRAEAQARLGNTPEALTDLNAIRRRSGLANSTATGAAVLDAVLRERRIELAFEGHRWFDLTRLGQNIPKPAGGVIPFNDYRILPPIPIGDLQVNTKLVQNPGY
jgi:starch-binding outer membrane protein, SusD/RagB family